MVKRLLTLLAIIAVLSTETRADGLGYSKEHPLTFALDLDYAPMEYIDDNGKPAGLDVEFTNILMERLGIPVNYKPNEWDLVADDIMKGRCDLGMMVYSPYRKDLTNYSRAVFRLYYQLITRKRDNHDGGLRDVEGKRIALLKSKPVIDTLTALGAKVVVVKDLTRTLRELAKGEYDGVICFRYQARYLIGRHQLENLKSEELTLMPREYCYVSHNARLIKAIDQELLKMENDGEIDKVYGDLRSRFDGLHISQWVWYLLAAVFIAGLLLTVILQLRSRRRLMAEMAYARTNLERALKSEEEARLNAEEAHKNAEEARMNAEEARKNEERATKSEELKGIFLSNVSHALRTPLNAIIGFSDLMLSAKPGEMENEEQKKLLTMINDNGLQLLHLINELLSLSDIEGKSKFFNMEVVDIVAEMDSYAAELRPTLHEGVTLEVVEPVEGLRALVDRQFMRLVNMHLLQNAVDHTTEGKITLTFYAKQGGIYCEVRDTGTGLPENLKQNIFALLNDKNTYLQDETPGLGLTICKAICDKMGGEIGARDNDIDGRGTIIWTWAPVEIV